MDEARIRAIARQEIQTASAAARFQLSPNNRHVHNNVDAPYVFLPYAVYAGFVPYDLTASGLESILPNGWTVRYDATGYYTIVHNLGTSLYALVADATQSTNAVVSPVVSPFDNEVTVAWFDNTDTATDTSFNFVLVQVNNKSDTFPTYNAKNVS